MVAASRGCMLATTVARPGEMNSAAWNMPKKPKLVAPMAMTITNTQDRPVLGIGRRVTTPNASRHTPARAARIDANAKCGAKSRPIVMSGKQVAQSTITASRRTIPVVVTLLAPDQSTHRSTRPRTEPRSSSGLKDRSVWSSALLSLALTPASPAVAIPDRCRPAGYGFGCWGDFAERPSWHRHGAVLSILPNRCGMNPGTRRA